jgi:hypothetical protein
MSEDVYLADNSGNRVPPGAVAVDPVAASGISLAGGTAGSDVTQPVVGGKLYAITSIDSNWLFSITGVTSTAANIEWVLPEDATIIIRIPLGVTTLYFECDGSSKTAYMREVAE